MSGILVFAIIAVIGVFGITNALVVGQSKEKMVTAEAAKAHQADCILVLGASVLPDGTPSSVLRDRLDEAIALYFAGVAPKIIMSGDNGSHSYNEVLGMKNYAVKQGVPSEDIFCDHAGFSTYESMYRAHQVFGVDRMVVVTQTYHQYRALYSANGLGIDAVGVASDRSSFNQQMAWDMREVPARTKDFFQTMFKTEPTFSGESISLDQSGDITEQ